MSDPYASIASAADPYAGIAKLADLIAPRKKVSTAEDVARSGVSGAHKGFAGLADTLLQATPIGQISNTLTTAANLADTMKTGRVTMPAAPISPNSQNALRTAYTPQTTAGRYAETIGENLPNALAPGGAVRRVANVVVPAVTSQAATDAAKAAGAGRRGQAVARVAGGGVGAVLASVNPRAMVSAAQAAKPAAAPTLDELQTAKDAAYKAVDDSGVRYTPEAFSDLMTGTANKLDAEGFHAGLHPKTAQMMQRIGESQRASSGYSPTLTELDQLRQQIGRDVASSADPGERRMGQIMRDQIDGFVSRADPSHVTGGDPQTAADLITKARDLNTRVSKLRSLDNLDEAAVDRAAATGTGANGENASRQNMIRFQRDTGNLTPDEAAATQTAIRGTRTQNALRAVGSFSPEGGTVRAGMSIATGAASHGVLPAVGFVARRVSDALAQRNVQALRDLIASGGQAAQVVQQQIAAPQYADIRRQLADDLAAGLAVSSSAIPLRAGAEPSAQQAR